MDVTVLHIGRVQGRLKEANTPGAREKTISFKGGESGEKKSCLAGRFSSPVRKKHQRKYSEATNQRTGCDGPN